MSVSKTKSVSTSITSTVKISNYKLVPSWGNKDLDSARFYYVGQGDCIGLETNGKIPVYVDYGGLLDHPNPTQLGVQALLPIGSGARIILTHWDWDHYNSARHNPDAQNHAEWIVPRQLVGPRALIFANSLKKAKCWPDSVGTTAYRFSIGTSFEVQIQKCAPSPSTPGQKEDRNLTGLAVAVIKQDANGNDVEYVLLPGDAPYHKIPSIGSLKGDCIAMTAYHHGSHAHWTRATDQQMPVNGTNSKRLIYSYGPNNSYGHPDRKKYVPSNWDAQAVTSKDIMRKKNQSEDVIL